MSLRSRVDRLEREQPSPSTCPGCGWDRSLPTFEQRTDPEGRALVTDAQGRPLERVPDMLICDLCSGEISYIVVNLTTKRESVHGDHATTN